MKKRVFTVFSVFLAAMLFGALFSRTHAAAAEPDTDARAGITLQFLSVTMRYDDAPLLAPDHIVYEEFHERRINAPHGDKLKKVEECLKMGAGPKPSMLYCYPKLQQFVDDFIAKVSCEPVESQIRFRPYETPMFTISREKIGYAVNEERLYYDIYNALRANREAVVNVRADVLKPARTADDYAACTHKRAAYSTNYESSNENRKHNIRLALSKINGLRLDDGEEFSFNQVVGRRTEARGFAVAKIIRNGEYVDGVGGGVCQASTTVYNCALRADMTITDVLNHSLVPSYVPPSMDAMVNSHSSDLKFKNTSGMPIFIRAFGTDSRAVVEIYGLKMPYTVAAESTVISRTDMPEDKIVVDTDFKYITADMQRGDRLRVSNGVPGLTSEGYLLFYKDGKLVEKRLVRKDTYKPMRGLVAEKP